VNEACQEPQHEGDGKSCEDEAGNLLDDMHGIAPSYPLSGQESQVTQHVAGRKEIHKYENSYLLRKG
jgi:hypothetical protein